MKIHYESIKPNAFANYTMSISDAPTWKPTSGYNCPECKKLFVSHETFIEHATKCGRISDAELDEMELVCAKLAEGPYFVSFDDAKDCPDHTNSGLAMVDTGRSEDWPIARLCEWPTAKAIAAILPIASRLIAALRSEQAKTADLENRSHQTVFFTCGCVFKQAGLDDEPKIINHCGNDSLRAELEAERARTAAPEERKN